MAGLKDRPRGKDLAAEIGKKKPFEHAEEEAYLNLLRTTSMLSWQFEQLFKAHGLSEATYNVLRILRGAGLGGGGGRSCSDIGEDMVTRVPDVTRLVDRLEEAGLVERCRVPEDRRVVRVKITGKGLGLLTSLDKPGLKLIKAQLGHLSRSELAELSRLLVKARAGEGMKELGAE